VKRETDLLLSAFFDVVDRSSSAVKEQRGGDVGSYPPIANEVMDCVLAPKFNGKVSSSGIKWITEPTLSPNL
jgi:hypothetical protein